MESARDIYEGLGDRFRVHLVSIVNPAGLTARDLSAESEGVASILGEIAKRLRAKGLDVTTSVLFGVPEEMAVRLGSEDRYDVVVVLAGRRPRKAEERGLARLISARLPGKVLVLRR